MIRIGPPQLPPTLAPPSPGPEPVPQDDPTAQEPKDDSPKPKPRYDAQKVSLKVSGYMGPDQGPFECQGCEHWEDQGDGKSGSCEIVSGSIDPHGCCNLFEKGVSQDDDQDAPEGSSEEEAGESPEEEALEAKQGVDV